MTAVVAALFLVPTSNGAAVQASLRVTPPSGSYGGQSVRWEGNTGATGVQRVWLQRRGSKTAAWADVPDSFYVDETDARGNFDFRFPAPAMNFVYFRVKSREGASPQHEFQSKHQDADLAVVEHDPADVPLPQTPAVGTAVVDESFSLAVDTVNGARGETKRPLPGRDVTLQRRNSDSSWSNVAFGQLNRDGLLRFGPYDGSLQVPGDYRVRLEQWTENGDDVGWFVSLPSELRVVRRPEPVRSLRAAPTSSSSVALSWALPADARRDKIRIYRAIGAEIPTAAKPWQQIAALDGSRTSYTDTGLVADRPYNYAVYTVAADGVYTRVPTRVTTATPAEG